jgi:hypothetical protein
VEHVTALARARRHTGAGRAGLAARSAPADLNGTAARIGVHGNRYNEQHMSLVGR